MKMKLFLCIVICICIQNGIFAQIWTNPITGTNPNLNDPYTTGQTVTANLTVSGIGRGSGIAGTNSNNRYNAIAWKTTSLDTSKYFYFTLTAAAGYRINFTNFIYTGQASGTGPSSVAFRSSLDGYTTDIGAPTVAGATISLAAATYQNITTSITFRFYAWNASTNGGTFSINDFTFNGGVTPVAAGTSYATDNFRSTTSGGNWSSPSTWESWSGTSWIGATLVPDQSAASIVIQSAATVTIDANAYSKSLTIDAGGTLINPNANLLTISDDGTTAYDFNINGTYILYGKQPSMNGYTSCQVSGLVKVKDNTGGESDDFGRSSRVLYNSTSVFQWDSNQFFETGTSGLMTYLPGSSLGAVFRVTANLVGVGSGTNSVLFDCKFEVGAGYTVKFQRNGTKYFRDGLGGDGTLTHWTLNGGASSNCGLFQITGSSAVIDGMLTIDIEHNAPTTDFEISGTVTISGSPTINIGNATSTDGTLVVSGNLLHNGTIPINLDRGNLMLSGFISGSGTFTANSTNTTITVAKTTAATAGVLKLTSGANTVHDFIMGLSAPLSSTSSRVSLGTSIIVSNNLKLEKGIIVTGNNLLTWNNSGGTLTAPQSSYAANSTSYTNSFIATCDDTGTPINVADATTAFDGTAGFQIKNVSSTNTYFPVGASYITAATGQAASPNRMMISNQSGTPTDYTVVVNYGDIGYTNGILGTWRVNRIWYVKSNNAGTEKATMQLFFTKRNWSSGQWPTDENEVEGGFNYAQTALVQKDYSAGRGNMLNLSVGADRQDFTNAGSYPDNTEIYGLYTINVSDSLTNGIAQFNRFSVVNPGSDIVLPLTLTNLKAYQQGNNISINWSALNELNVNHYEVEHSSDGIHFETILKAIALNNGSKQNDYTTVDKHPFAGKNFYRVKSIDKSGTVNYSSIVSVTIGGGRIFIAVLPNPVQNKHINLQLNNIAAGTYNLLLYNTAGQRVFTATIMHVGGSSCQVISLPSNVKTGTYLLNMQNKVSHYTQGLIIE